MEEILLTQSIGQIGEKQPIQSWEPKKQIGSVDFEDILDKVIAEMQGDLQGETQSNSVEKIGDFISNYDQVDLEELMDTHGGVRVDSGISTLEVELDDLSASELIVNHEDKLYHTAVKVNEVDASAASWLEMHARFLKDGVEDKFENMWQVHLDYPDYIAEKVDYSQYIQNGIQNSSIEEQSETFQYLHKIVPDTVEKEFSTEFMVENHGRERILEDLRLQIVDLQQAIASA